MSCFSHSIRVFLIRLYSPSVRYPQCRDGNTHTTSCDPGAHYVPDIGHEPTPHASMPGGSQTSGLLLNRRGAQRTSDSTTGAMRHVEQQSYCRMSQT